MSETDKMSHKMLEKLLEDAVDATLHLEGRRQPSQSEHADPAASGDPPSAAPATGSQVGALGAPLPTDIEWPYSNIPNPFVRPSKSPTAMMHASSSKGPSLASRVNTPGLPVIDLATAKELYAILDDGCNSTCHTEKYAEKAQSILAQFGKKMTPLEGDGVGYKGLGKAHSKGTRNIP